MILWSFPSRSRVNVINKQMVSDGEAMVDADNIVRKVTIKYELPLSGLNHDLVPSAYKYAERNVRNLALVVTAQECEEINIAEVRARYRPEETEEYY